MEVDLAEQGERPTKIRRLSHSPEPDHSKRLRRNSSSEEGSQEIIVSDHDSDDENGSRGQQTVAAAPDQEIDSSTPLSKNQLKKIKKRQEWEAGREFRKSKRKQKTREKRERKKAATAERKANGEIEEFQPRKPRHPVVLPITLVIDCGFDDLMMEKEYISLGSQLTRAYSDNSRSALQAHLVISSWNGKLRNRFDTTLSGHYKQWKGTRFMDEDFLAVSEMAKEWMKTDFKSKQLAGAFAKFRSSYEVEHGPCERREASNPDVDPTHPNGNARIDAVEINGTPSSPAPAQAPPPTEDTNTPTLENTSTTNTTPASLPFPEPEIVYLTADSPHTLTTLSPFSTYIIGGIVDKNRHKGICYKIARENGIKTAKLPIGEFMEMQSRSVLATNHVVEIMLRWLECGDWGESFLKVIPKRKGGVLKGEGAEESIADGNGEGGVEDVGNGVEEDGRVEGDAIDYNEGRVKKDTEAIDEQDAQLQEAVELDGSTT